MSPISNTNSPIRNLQNSPSNCHISKVRNTVSEKSLSGGCVNTTLPPESACGFKQTEPESQNITNSNTMRHALFHSMTNNVSSLIPSHLGSADLVNYLSCTRALKALGNSKNTEQAKTIIKEFKLEFVKTPLGKLMLNTVPIDTAPAEATDASENNPAEDECQRLSRSPLFNPIEKLLLEMPIFKLTKTIGIISKPSSFSLNGSFFYKNRYYGLLLGLFSTTICLFNFGPTAIFFFALHTTGLKALFTAWGVVLYPLLKFLHIFFSFLNVANLEEPIYKKEISKELNMLKFVNVLFLLLPVTKVIMLLTISIVSGGFPLMFLLEVILVVFETPIFFSIASAIEKNCKYVQELVSSDKSLIINFYPHYYYFYSNLSRKDKIQLCKQIAVFKEILTPSAAQSVPVLA